MGKIFERNGNWYIGYYHGEKRFRKKIGKNKKTAELALADIELKIAREEHLGGKAKPKLHFEKFAEDYLEYCRTNTSRSTYARYKGVVNCFLAPFWKGKSLTEITSKSIEDYKTSRSELVKAGTVNKELTVIKSMFRQAFVWEFVPDNPASKVKYVKEPKPTFRYLTEGEIEIFLNVCKKSKSKHLYTATVIALKTGMRRGEVFNLQWQDIDFTRCVINVVSREGAHTKNYESRSIPMTPILADALKNHPRSIDSPFVFAKDNGLALECLRAFRRSFHKVMKNHQMAWFRFHDLRHTFASRLVMKGVDLRTVQELLGHKDIRVTLRYAHLAPEHLKSAVDVLDSWKMSENSATP